MFRFALMALACVPVVLWGVDELTPAAVPAANPKPLPEPVALTKTKGVLASERALNASLALSRTAPEPKADGSKLHEAATEQAEAVAEAARFAKAFRKPLNEKGQLVANEADFNNKALKAAWKDHGKRAKDASDGLTALHEKHNRAALRGPIEVWLKALPEQIEKWESFPDEVVNPVAAVVAAFGTFETKYSEQIELAEKAKRSKAEWQKCSVAMTDVNKTLSDLAKTMDEGKKAELRLAQLRLLAALVNLGDVGQDNLTNARLAVGKVCATMLPRNLPLDKVVTLTRTFEGEVTEYPGVPRQEVEVVWLPKAKMKPQRLGNGLDGKLTEFDLVAPPYKELVEDFHWNNRTYSGILPTKMSTAAHTYNTAVVATKANHWTPAALRQVHAACKGKVEGRLPQTWATLEALLPIANSCPRLFE